MGRLIGLLGGTFDPVHFGHLRLALELRQSLGLDEMRLLPCHRPAHRPAPGLDSAERSRLLRLALADCPALLLDERELRRDQPSYTVDTLRELRAELGAEVSLVWALGTDAFAALDTWHRWRELTDLAHLAVIARPGYPLPVSGPVAELLRARQAPLDAVGKAPAGAIVVPALRWLDISASDIRAQVAAGHSPQFLLPEAVLQEIHTRHHYRLNAPRGEID